MTAAQLLHALDLAGCGPHVDGHTLRLRATPPKELARYIAPLQTGLRAILTKRHWYYTATPGTHRAGGELDPTQPLPSTACLLYTEGDPYWDRIPAHWHEDMPELFGPVAKKKGAA